MDRANPQQTRSRISSFPFYRAIINITEKVNEKQASIKSWTNLTILTIIFTIIIIIIEALESCIRMLRFCKKQLLDDVITVDRCNQARERYEEENMEIF